MDGNSYTDSTSDSEIAPMFIDLNVSIETVTEVRF